MVAMKVVRRVDMTDGPAAVAKAVYLVPWSGAKLVALRDYL